jgi:hypothetical protein
MRPSRNLAVLFLQFLDLTSQCGKALVHLVSRAKRGQLKPALSEDNRAVTRRTSSAALTIRQPAVVE